MSNEVFWILDLSINDGMLEDFHVLKNEMVANVEATEPGTLSYDWFLSDDNKLCHLYERYTDSEAVSIHLAAFFEKYAERFFAATTVNRFVVYGNPSDEVRQALGGAGAKFMSMWH